MRKTRLHGRARCSAIALFFLITLSLISLFVIGHYAKGYINLYFACPKINDTVSIEKASELDLTYESVSGSAGIKVYSVNHAYGRIMEYRMMNGSFFTRAAQNEKRKNVVLNEKLAFETFGSFDILGNIFKINSEPYIVVGIMDDKQDEKNAYIPASETASYFLAVIDTEEKTIADLKSLGINENRFHLVNLNEIAGVIIGKSWLALIIAVILILGVITRKTMMRIFVLAKKIKLISREKYWGEIFTTKEMLVFVMLALVAVIEIVGALCLFLKSVEIALGWANYAGELDVIAYLGFGGKVQLLKDLFLYSNIAFCVFIGGVLLYGINIKEYK